MRFGTLRAGDGVDGDAGWLFLLVLCRVRGLWGGVFWWVEGGSRGMDVWKGREHTYHGIRTVAWG